MNGLTTTREQTGEIARPVANTSTGWISGIWNASGNQCLFLGIPYAEPPLRGLRFKPPVPKRSWAGIFDASRFGHAGPQVFDSTEGSYEEFTGENNPVVKKAWVGAEDNLTLNVWTPAPDNGQRPVLVWIHGGANWLESSRLETYHGDKLVAHGDIVFVSINYRLGVFGFLDMSVIGGEAYRGSHMNGLRDQVLALRWIKENIAAFGGDPDNITVMGESAGSIDLSWLLTSGHLDGIARRVVLMSGVAGLIGLSGDLARGFTEEYGREQAKKFLSRLSIDSMSQLQAMTTDQIMDRVTALARSSDMLFEMDSLFWPRISDDFPVDPFRAARNGINKNIDVMIGYTAYEMGLWLTWDETLDQHPCAWSAEKIQDFSPSLQKKAVQLYGDCFAKEPSGRHGMHMIGDSIFVIPATWFADELSLHHPRIWMYQFDWETDERRRALHAADQTYLFGSLGTHAGHHLTGIPKDEADRLAREELSAAMQDYIIAFVRSGDPNKHKNGDLPLWPAYEERTRPVMSFDLQCKIINDPISVRRQWWYKNLYGPAIKGKKQ